VAQNEGLSATDLATLGKLIPVLPALEELCASTTTKSPRLLYSRRAAAGGILGPRVPKITTYLLVLLSLLEITK
jgi:hypothetical protein